MRRNPLPRSPLSWRPLPLPWGVGPSVGPGGGVGRPSRNRPPPPLPWDLGLSAGLRAGGMVSGREGAGALNINKDNL